jgi:putative hydrolase of the HAD superfamily
MSERRRRFILRAAQDKRKGIRRQGTGVSGIPGTCPLIPVPWIRVENVSSATARGIEWTERTTAVRGQTVRRILPLCPLPLFPLFSLPNSESPQDDVPTMLTRAATTNPTDSHSFSDAKQIRCIAFDAVGTLIEPVPSAAEAYHRVARQHGSRLTADEIARRFRSKFRETERGDLADPIDIRLATSEAAERERWRAIVVGVIDDVDDPEVCFEELFAHFADPTSWRCFDDVPAALEGLRQAGFNLVLASNFDGRLRRVCDGLPAVRNVTCRVISAEVGFRKPSPRFFKALIAAAGCRAEELLMIGDDRRNDWEGARQAGLPALLINRAADRAPDEIGSLSELTYWLGSRAN